MPFRFRKIFKIAPGVKINLSKSGLSTSLGKAGASLNIGKKGVRTTLGIPGTGLSVSKLHSASNTNITQSLEQPDAPPDYQPAGSVSSGPKNPKIKIPLGCVIPTALIAMCCQAFFCFSMVNGIVNPPPSPTIDVNAINTQAMQTVIGSLPTATSTFTPLPTNTELPTSTPLPTETETPLPTNTPFVTATLPPNCLAAYPRFCIEPGDRKSCEELPSNFPVLPPDPFGYDGDGDGFGCEN